MQQIEPIAIKNQQKKNYQQLISYSNLWSIYYVTQSK